MRILYLVDSYRPSRSACANRTVVLVEALRKAGHDVQVLASSDSLIDVSDDYEKPDYVTFFRTYPLVEKTLINRLKNNFGGCFSSIEAAKHMGKFDAVICTTPPLLLAESAIKISQQKNAKLILDIRDIWPDVAYEMGSFSPSSFYGRFFERLAKKANQAADMIVSVSPGKIEKLKKRVPDGRVELIPNGIDELFLSNVEDAGLIERLRLDEGRICAYVGNIGLAQGLGTLLDIAKIRPSVRFLLFGKGADETKLRDRVASEEINNIEFCGTVDARGVYTVLRKADFAYVPLVSSDLRDSIPTKIYEALACGCPVLLAAKGDAADLVDESGLGVHAAPEDSAALLRIFDWLIENPYSRDKRAAASQWVAENHSRQKCAKRFSELITALDGGDA